jgi:putative sterol carrier protein
VGVKFLSEEWVTQVKEAINSNEAFKNAAGSQAAKIQQVVNGPDEEVKYYFDLKDGQLDIALGEVDSPDATITQDYDTAAALSKNELTGTAAYMSGKLKVSGDLMKLMAMQGVFNQIPQATSSIEVEY